MKSNEYQQFENTMKQLMKVPHSEIKERLEAEKKAKKAKNRKISKKTA